MVSINLSDFFHDILGAGESLVQGRRPVVTIPGPGETVDYVGYASKIR